MIQSNKGKFYFTLVLFSLLGQVAWVVENMYFNVFISTEFGASQFQVALMVSLSAIVATLTTLFVGAFSDKVGKRKLFIWLGYIIWGITILAFSLFNVETISKVVPASMSAASVGITLVILFDCIMTFFGSSANDACFNSWITDTTDNTNRGKVEGINSMMPLVAILVVFGLLSGFAKKGSWWILFLIIGALTIIAGIIGIFSIVESKVEIGKDENYFKRIFYGFKITSLKENKILYLTYLSFAVFGVAIQIFMTYLVQYYQAYIPGTMLGMDKYVFIMAPAIVLAAVATFFYGRVYDKIHFKKTIIPSLLVLLLGLVLLSFTFLTQNLVLIFIGSLFLMSGYLCSSAIFNAKIRDHTPVDKVGSFQGIKMFAQVLIPMLVGPWIGAAAISGDFSYNMENVLVPEGYEYTVNPGIFVGAGIIVVLCLVSLTLVFIYEGKQHEKK
ncbi:MAG: MFS transporter [Erysipelotrichales bacterium]|nr:MFS transporter [Erysipelotrichales bacterium]